MCSNSPLALAHTRSASLLREISSLSIFRDISAIDFLYFTLIDCFFQHLSWQTDWNFWSYKCCVALFWPFFSFNNLTNRYLNKQQFVHLSVVCACFYSSTLHNDVSAPYEWVCYIKWVSLFCISWKGIFVDSFPLSGHITRTLTILNYERYLNIKLFYNKFGYKMECGLLQPKL